jgi:hypothetical protein
MCADKNFPEAWEAIIDKEIPDVEDVEALA